MLPRVPTPPESPITPPNTPRRDDRSRKFRFSTEFSRTSIRDRLADLKNRTATDHAERNPWTEGDPYRFSPPKKRDPWEECIKLVERHDDENCRGWKEHIDTLLVFAGLFSAAVTAFIIESYRQLQEDPNEASLRILTQISQQLLNSSNPLTVPNDMRGHGMFIPTSSAIRINTCWFLSLTLSLSTALFGILCKQWLHEYRRDVPTASHKDSLGLRHMRFEGFHKWGVPIVLSILPILLQISLVLFFAGLLDLLWSLHYIPAIVTTLAVSSSVLVLIFTTVLPAYYVLTWNSRSSTDSVFLCPYKSPQSWWVYRLVHFLSTFVRANSRNVRWHLEASDWASVDFKLFRSHQPPSFDCHTYPVRSLKWIRDVFGDNLSTAFNLFHCLQEVNEEEEAFVIGEDGGGKRDALNQKFLSSHSWDKDVQLFCAELALRQINTSPGSNNIGAYLWYLTLPGAIDCENPAPEYEIFLHQLLSTLKHHLLQEHVNSQDVDPLLSISRMLWTHPVRSVRLSSLSLLDDINSWLSKPSNDGAQSAQLLQRIRKCCTAILFVMSSTTRDFSAFASSDHTPRFIRSLDRHLNDLNHTIDPSSESWTRRYWIQTREIVDYLETLWPPSAENLRGTLSVVKDSSTINWSPSSGATTVIIEGPLGDDYGDQTLVVEEPVSGS
ncbi:hypothetical protein E1B28_013150 [Marasmius oreades]|uniref:DUF6535 domain-containing protein n=1 Tax=Marasmius oreades TaxID=181124 RepID=A0A9P7UMP8_9AGAR|nr:uncharacterized protein E1B28_013150 [Marasmius oreades]KAG7087170.1 hypothetical protein E1B28_013150 [Marasmius oreades]